jgi:hypothetical protein
MKEKTQNTFWKLYQMHISHMKTLNTYCSILYPIDFLSFYSDHIQYILHIACCNIKLYVALHIARCMSNVKF